MIGRLGSGGTISAGGTAFQVQEKRIRNCPQGKTLLFQRLQIHTGLRLALGSEVFGIHAGLKVCDSWRQ
jgi:hypothetical protein